MSFRKERKYKLTISEFDRLKNQLLRIGMNNLFQPRKINSLYYDTDAYDLHHHSEDGVVPRKKIRIRWYDSVKNASVETKISSIEGRYKIKKPKILTGPDSFPKVISDQVYGILTPSLLVSYEREYYTLKGMRLTFDSKITYKDYRSVLSMKYDDAERVMEIKVSVDTSEDFIEKHIPYPTSRFSKYSRGILFCNNDI